jgi:hypothetical protein
MRESTTSLNVIVANYANEGDASRAVEVIEQLDGQGHIQVGEIGIIERTTMGWVAPKSLEKGSSIEGLADALNVPEGLDLESAAAALSFIGRQVPEGSVAVVAIVAEREGEPVLDRELAKLGGPVGRRSAIDVFTHIEELMDLQERRKEFRARAQEKLEAVVKNKIRDKTSLLDRLDQTFSKPFE